MFPNNVISAKTVTLVENIGQLGPGSQQESGIKLPLFQTEKDKITVSKSNRFWRVKVTVYCHKVTVVCDKVTVYFRKLLFWTFVENKR